MKRKTKNENKINKKKGLAENKQGKKQKRAFAHRIGVTKMKLLKKRKKIDDREEQKTSQKHKGENGRESNLKKKKRKHIKHRKHIARDVRRTW